jgi:hypothetical protein
MTGPTYDQILNIMHRAMSQADAAGHDLRCCVWELSPSICRTIRDHWNGTCQMVVDFRGDRKESFNGIPIRQGVTDEGAGILLKMVNQNPNE